MRIKFQGSGITKPTGVNAFSEEGIGDVSTGNIKLTANITTPREHLHRGTLAQTFPSAPLSQALRKQDFPATLMLLSRGLTVFVPSFLVKRTEFSYPVNEQKLHRSAWELLIQLRLVNSVDIKYAVNGDYPGFPSAVSDYIKRVVKRKGISSSPYPQGTRHEVMVLNGALGELC